ncbi:hypothetical protein [Nocardia barduliensis]|uniref:hypothetical protein n=1 Tax=Nocardia barduliensis TaxID=2736643 RepID=UPI001FE76D65|nr:hypothetical protein [Nocardia barduliensis]
MSIQLSARPRESNQGRPSRHDSSHARIEVGAVLPTSLELLRAVRGHSVDAQGGPLARVITGLARDLADCYAAEPTGSQDTGPKRARAQLLLGIETLLSTALPHLPSEDRDQIGRTVDQVAQASVEFHRSLRQHGGADERVRVQCREAAALADRYAALVASAIRRQPWSPQRQMSTVQERE